MSERDPRQDPRPGDVVRKGEIDRHVVEVRIGLLDSVYVIYHSNYYRPFHESPLSRWRNWCRGAEVVAAAAGTEG